MQLLDLRQEVRASARLRVVRRPLVRILAVGEIEHLHEARGHPVGEELAVGEPLGDARLVGGRRRERLGREPAAGLEREIAARQKLGEHLAVLSGTRDRRDVREVLRGRPEHGRPSDVDHLDRVFLADAVPRDQVGERIEVHAHEVERLDRVLAQSSEVVGLVAAGEDGRVDLRMQGLDPASEQLRYLRQLLDPRDLEACFLESLRGAPACHELALEVDEAARELDHPRLLVDRDQSPQSSLTTRGSSLCSADWTRARSVSTLSLS
jgi:hypothetical protein